MEIRILNNTNIFGIEIKEVMMPDSAAIIKNTIEVLNPLFKDKPENLPYSCRNGMTTIYYKVKQDLVSIVDLTLIEQFVTEQAQIYWNDLHFNPKLKVEIINSWANMGPPGTDVWPHQHAPTPITAVFYLQGESGDLVLENPMEALLAQQPYEMTFSQRLFNHNIKPTPGKLVLFPGWIKHYANTNESNQDRIVLAFNLFGRGGLDDMFGKGDSRTEKFKEKFTHIQDTWK